MQVQFSEDIDGATFTNNNGWAVAGFNFKDVPADRPLLISADAADSADPPDTPTGGTADVVRLLLKEKTDDFSTDIDPAVDQVTYSAAVGDVADLSTSPNALDNIFVGTAPEVDRARPILLDAKTGDIITTPAGGQIDQYEIRFSEPVNARGGEADFILLDDFAAASLNDNLTSTLTLVITGTGAIDTGVRPGLGVNIDTASDTAGIVDLAKDRLGVNAPNGLAAPSDSYSTLCGVTFNLVPDAKRLDGVPPLIRRDAVVTGDSNGDGRLDQLLVEFTEIMPADRDYVSGVTIGGIAPARASRTAADQVTYTLTVARGAPPNTGAVPDYLYSAARGGISDPAGLRLLDIGSADIAEVDGAAPVLVSAVTDDADGDGKIDKYVITASEPISIAGDAASLGAALGVEVTTLQPPPWMQPSSVSPYSSMKQPRQDW